MNTSSLSESNLEVMEFIFNVSIPRNLRRRRNPFEMFTDEEFQLRYRFNKNTVIHLSTFQVVIGDDINVHKTTVSRVVFKVSKEIAKLATNYIGMTNFNDLREVKAQFFNIAGFPNVIGCVDGSHILIQSPGGEEAELFRNRKGFFSINVQVA